tara:strand:+ start:41 stop:1099 length:1059 start_codon:yes stop_codon:yes gene_type:complete
MQEKEYAQIYEMGLGSLIGDFFQNVKDTVTGVAKAVAPIAPFVLPFVAPGIGSLVGGKLGTFLASKLGQAAIGAGIQGLAGKKPADIAKSLALQVATSGIKGALSGGEGTIGQKFMSGVTGREIPQVPTNNINLSDVGGGGGGGSDVTFMDRLRQQFDPRLRAENPRFNQLKALGYDEKQLAALGVSPESSLYYQYGPALQTGLATLPAVEQAYNYLRGPEEEEQVSENLYAMDPAAYQIGSITGYNPQGYFLGAAEGGEVTGFAQDEGQKIKHPDGDTKEHPKRIGEIVGRGTGTSDDIPAMLSDGEFVMTAKAVRNAGGGSRKVGAKNMYKMMKSLEKGGSLSQQSIGMA